MLSIIRCIRLEAKVKVKKEGIVIPKEFFKEMVCTYIKMAQIKYVDQELGSAPDTERKFYQRLRDMPKIKDCQCKQEGRGFKGNYLKNKEAENSVQTQLKKQATEAEVADNLPSKNNFVTEVDSSQLEICVASASASKPKENIDCSGQSGA
jgi:uncharacterized protein (DUF885 family)